MLKKLIPSIFTLFSLHLQAMDDENKRIRQLIIDNLSEGTFIKTDIKRSTQADLSFFRETIIAENVDRIEIVLSTTIKVEGYDSYDIEGNFNMIGNSDDSIFRNYIADIGLSQLQGFLMGEVPELFSATLKKSFYFDADKNGDIKLKLLIPSQFKIESIEACE